MIDVHAWARSTPPGRDARHVLEELDHLQGSDATTPSTPVAKSARPAVDDASLADRSAALDILVRRRVLVPEVADAVRDAPLGQAARSWAATRPGAEARVARAVPRRSSAPSIAAARSDLGGTVGAALVAVAPVIPVLSVAGVIDSAAAMWLSTLALLAGALVLAVSGGRFKVNATERRGRYSAGQLTVLASVAILTPAATIATAFSDLGAARFVGACLGYQAMTIVVLFALAAVARKQEQGGPRRRPRA